MISIRRTARREAGGSLTHGPGRRGLGARASGFGMLALLAGLAACGETPEVDTEQAAPEMGGDAVVAVNPWVRMAIMPEGSDAPDAPPVNSAAYMRLQNPTGTDDALVAVESAVSDTVEIHTVTMDNGVMRMRALEDGVDIPAGGEAVLEPGGFHIMLIGLNGPLSEGDTVALTLRLRSGEALEITAPVLRAPPQM